MRAIECPCGRRFQAADDEELFLAAARPAVAGADHPLRRTP
jgi:hypothetical protein